MPIFEFKCDDCGKEFERLVFSSGKDPVACPDCNCTKTRKLLSVFACSGTDKILAGSGCSSHSGHSGHS